MGLSAPLVGLAPTLLYSSYSTHLLFLINCISSAPSVYIDLIQSISIISAYYSLNMTGAQSSFPAPNGLTPDQQQQLFNMQLKQLEDENKRKENEQNLRLRQMEEEHAVKMEALRSTVRGSGGSEQLESEGKIRPIQPL